MKKTVILVLVTALVMLLGAAVTTASGDAYIQINNGSMISVTATEKPQIAVQFGSQYGLDNVFIRCSLDEGAYFTEQVYTHGSFDRAVLGTVVNNVRFISNDHPAYGTDFGPGQHRNVAMTVAFAEGAAPGDEFDLNCRLLQLTPDPTDGYAQSTLDIAYTTIVIR